MRTIIIDDDKASVDTLTKKLKKFSKLQLPWNHKWIKTAN